MEEDNVLHDEDIEDVRLCKKGTVEAFERLVLRHEKKVLNIAYRMIGNYEDACEVVQDAFLSAYRNIRNFREQSRFSTWLYTITVNLSKNRIKQMGVRAHREPFSIDDPAGEEGGRREPASGVPSVLERLEQRELDGKIQDCLGSLDHEFREVIVLRDVQGFSYREICDMLSIAEGTVKSRLFRARESVRNCLKKSLGGL